MVFCLWDNAAMSRLCPSGWRVADDQHRAQLKVLTTNVP
jgi:hypothetical protein